jgi:SAM-dependent methyltransferase
MPFKFAVERENYADYASGKVFYNLPGHPAFPVRLASEVLQRCLQLRSARGLRAPVRLYDPCCGGAYHLAVLAYLHWDSIAEISASDIDNDALAVAKRNLSLLTLAGLEQRTAEIEEMQRLYQKDSHAEAAQSAAVLRDKLLQRAKTHQIQVDLLQADALQGQAVREHFADKPAELVISDLPYGLQSQWALPEAATGKDPAWLLLENLRDALADEAVVAIASTKQHKIAHEDYKQMGKFKSGKRQVVIFEKR